MSEIAYPHRWLVPETHMDDYDLLIGNDLLEKIGLLKVNYRTRKLELMDLMELMDMGIFYTFHLNPNSQETVITTEGIRFWSPANRPAELQYPIPIPPHLAAKTEQQPRSKCETFKLATENKLVTNLEREKFFILRSKNSDASTTPLLSGNFARACEMT